ncbi:MAG TPA: ribosomal protein S18-alanine N-acetyltransferase [Candidatus Sulfomarinibacteraceae bacterium]|nr:ribosomal protein S18-alanine N-acetyltransferase [Candidatus Sulfomarinibacteraceae bacterium]
MSERPRCSVRPPQPGDVRALAAAEAECFSDPWPEPYFISELYAPARFHRILVDQTGELAAYLFTAWQYLDLHVLKVATRPKYRRLGLGRRLMVLAEDHARSESGETLTLEVRTTNAAAIRLYDSLGFERVGVRRGYYADGDDALVMTKRVGDP